MNSVLWIIYNPFYTVYDEESVGINSSLLICWKNLVYVGDTEK